MSTSRTHDHLRGNAVAYLALFFAITGSAAAITPQIQSHDIADEAVNSRILRDNGVRRDDVGTGAIGARAVAECRESWTSASTRPSCKGA